MQQALIYCRVSSEEQTEKGYSLDAQEKFCRSFALNNGYRVAGVYREVIIEIHKRLVMMMSPIFPQY
jgi:DNA invertase Pin-like site-specific DNA recombinase